MTQYLLAVHYVEGSDTPSDEAMQQAYENVDRFNQKLQAAGQWVFGGGLETPDTATVVDGTGTDAIITDGPFAEGKEHLGGFTVITAPDLDAALDWGQQIAEISTLPCEVWPLRFSQGDLHSGQADLRSSDGG